MPRWDGRLLLEGEDANVEEFYRARMGRQFFDSTMTKVAKELERLNSN